ncbi:hypothetical protein [Ovoidimarina sediminis]|uniref:hypothetical protein n=1 Tax=Ovoidimarina sediminis TaxID=3079856 RepID=UPI0029067F22|nr:hypothetical protein [Rhodophyticola sp. MJ-SS7]MDU8944321.1 hypothetical protein [Rhodophyticola sp. MJ-SS7]
MIVLLGWVSLIVVLVIVAVVAYHLIGIYVALKRGADHLEKLAGGLTAIRDNTAPLNGRVDDINVGLSGLIAPLLAANGNLAAIVKVAGSR